MTLAAAEVGQDTQTWLAISEVTLGDQGEQEIPAAGSTHNVFVYGDVHPEGGGDGDDEILDAIRKLKIAVGLVTPDERELIAGEVHLVDDGSLYGDGDIDVLDALRDLRAAVGLGKITSCGGPG